MGEFKDSVEEMCNAIEVYKQQKINKEIKRRVVLTGKQERTAQQFLFWTAMEKQVKKNLNELKKDMKKIMVKHYDSDGKDKSEVFINGSSVGTVTAVKSSSNYEIVNEDKFADFLLMYDLGRYKHTPRAGAGDVIYSMLEQFYNPEQYACLFTTTLEPSDKFNKGVRNIGTDCIYTLTKDGKQPKTVIVDGVKSKKRQVKHTTAKTLDFQQILDTLTPEQTMKMLGGGNGGKDI